jgi:hypothetical protein
VDPENIDIVSDNREDLEGCVFAAENLVKTLSGVLDSKQRGNALGRRLKRMDTYVVLCVFKLIKEKAAKGHKDHLLLYYSLLSDTFRNEIGEDKVRELVDLARQEGLMEITSIFEEIPLKGAEDLPFQPFLDQELKETPLGIRKALARNLDHNMIQRVAKDQDPRVIETLLNNPRVTERQVVLIAATRPTTGRALNCIADHPKWIKRHKVKRAIALNPFTPVSLALKLLAFMRVQDLRQILESTEVSRVVKLSAERLLEKKGVNAPEVWELDLD